MANQKGFGTAPVFFTAIATILGAILFLRFGYAVGSLGFWGVMLIILLGHMVTIPTALSLSEIATNQKVEGGGEYFIISRSFGLNIGGTIGLALFFSQAISVAFYVIAFTEAFAPFFDWMKEAHNIDLPRQVISLPAMGLLSLLILTKGADLGVKALYIVVGILFISLTLFFLGSPEHQANSSFNVLNFDFKNMGNFFVIFAIIFPAFTGMTAGVGLSGDLRNPRKSIPLGTILGTTIGMVIYVFIVYKFKIAASTYDLTHNQLVMSKIALGGSAFVLLGLGASTISSALGSIMVAPRTLQALASDKTLPFNLFANFLSKGKGENNEPFNATVVTIAIAFVFVAMGSVDAVGKVISMFFMITYGSLNLISFLYHFGADPSYRPAFRTNKFISLLGFLMSVWLMFKIDSLYSIIAFLAMAFLYFLISRTHKNRNGIEAIFQGAVYQISMRLRLFAQQSKKAKGQNKWRPAVVCVSQDTFQRENAFHFLNWISYKYGYGTYIHLMRGMFDQQTKTQADETVALLLKRFDAKKHNVFVSTMISPSYTSAIAQIVQLPGISGMANNMVLFEYSKENPVNLAQIIDNYSLVEASGEDVAILASSQREIDFKKGIHIWIRHVDVTNANLMILLAYTMMGHPDWRKATVKIFYFEGSDEIDENRIQLLNMIEEGRIPISKNNVELIKAKGDINGKAMINKYSSEAGLVIVGFRGNEIQDKKEAMFEGLNNVGDVLFIHSHYQISMN